MKDLVVRLIGKDNLSATVREVQHEIDGLKGKSLDDINKKFLRIENSTAPLKAKLKSILALMALMNIDGLDLSPLFDRMAISAGRYKDAILDASQSIKNLSSDTLSMDATIQGFLAVSGAAAVAAGAFSLFGTESENLQKALVKIQSLIAIVLGFKAVADTLNKDSALMNWMRGFGAVSLSSKVAAQSTKAITAATTADSAALSANTAQRLANERSIAGSNPALGLNTKEFGANTQAIASNMAEIQKWNLISKDALEDYTEDLISVLKAELMYREATLEVGAAFLENILEATADSAERYIQALEHLTDMSVLLREAQKELGQSHERLEHAQKKIAEATNRVVRGESALNRVVQLTATSTKGAATATTGFSLSLAGVKRQATAAGLALKGLMASIPQMALFMALGIGITYAIEKLMSLGEQSEDTLKKLEKLKKKLEELRKKNEELAVSASKAKSKYWELLAAFKSLQTTAEKEKWLKDTNGEIKNLGINITKVKTAEDVFVKNTDSIISALIARAVAAKKAELAAELLIELDKKRSHKSVASGDYYTEATNDNVTKAERRKFNIPDTDTKANGYGGYSIVKHELTEKELEKINQERLKAARKRKQAISKSYDEEEQLIKKGVEDAVKAEMDANRKLAKFSDPDEPTTTPTITVEPKYDESADTEKAIHDNITVLLKQLETLAVTSDKYRDISDEIDRWKRKLSDIEALNRLNKNAALETAILQRLIRDGYIDEQEAKEAELGILRREIDALYQILDADDEQLKRLASLITAYKNLQKEVDNFKQKNKFEKGSIAELEELINLIEQKLLNTKLDLPARLKLLLSRYEIELEIRKLTDTYTIPVKILPYLVDDKLGSRQNAETNVQLVVELYESGIIDRNTLRKEVKEINEQLQQLGVKPIRLLLDVDFEGVETAVEAISSVKGIADYIGSIENAFDNCESALDYFTSGLELVISGLQTYMNVVQMITTVNDLLATSTKAASAASTAATATEVANSGTVIAAKSGEAIAGATASGASLPFPFNLLAIAAGIAAVIAALAAIGSFANGGIVSSGSLHGDRNLVRVNGLEMILNGKQLRNLFNLLNNGGGIRNSGLSGEVEFKIAGSTLRGVLKNYDNKMSKI